MPRPAHHRSPPAFVDVSTGASETDNSFPWLPTLAPLITSIALWIATGSALSLLFGVMSPVMLVAQFFESRRQSRRRRDAQDAQRETAEATERSRLTLERQRAAHSAQQEFPPAQALVALVELARLPVERVAHMRATPSPSVAPNGKDAAMGAHAGSRVRLGTTHDGHPVCVSAGDGIRVVGESTSPDAGLAHAGLAHVGPARRAVSRAVTAQLWWTTGDVNLTSSVLRAGSGGVARWLVTVVSLEQAFVLDRDAPARARTPIRPDTLSATDLERFRAALTQRGEQHRSEAKRQSELVLVSQASDHIGQFDVAVGETLEGHPFVMNLMREGPHCVVSGMTGSGKTSFIVGWLSRLCDEVAPSSLELAIIDFKGGIDFALLASYPHCVGFATDLEQGAIDRALLGLGAEVALRERELRSGKRLEELTRLIVVLDEFRAIASAHPRAIALIVDLAARGRALGIHLVVSTQRASSSISEDILANVPVRIAFRALTSNESTFLVGDDRAFRELTDPGDAIVASSVGTSIRVRMHPPVGGKPEAGHIVRHPDDAVASATNSPARRVWADSLPAQISRIEVEALPRWIRKADEVARESGSSNNYRLCLGVVDAHARQRWESAWYSPPHDGHLLITGTARAGRSSAIRALLDAVAAQTEHQVRAHVIDDEVELWDWFDPRCRRNLAIEGPTVSSTPVSSTPDSNTPVSKLILLDGIESLMSNLNPDARDELGERLMRALRTPESPGSTGSAHNAHVTRFVIACDSDSAWAVRLASLCAQQLDLVSAGQPGRARCAGAELQVPFVEEARRSTTPSTTATPATLQGISDVSVDMRIVVVDGDFFGPNPSPPRHDAIVASARARYWIEQLGEFVALTRDSAVLVRGNISPSDARVLFRGRTPLPPLWSEQSILLLPNGSYERLAG